MKKSQTFKHNLQNTNHFAQAYSYQQFSAHTPILNSRVKKYNKNRKSNEYTSASDRTPPAPGPHYLWCGGGEACTEQKRVKLVPACLISFTSFSLDGNFGAEVPTGS